MTTVAHRPPRGYRTLRLPLAAADYEQCISHGEFAKGQLDQLDGRHPEWFPEAWGQGYVFYGFTAPSRQQQQQRYRRVRLTATGVVVTVAPAFVMPYLSATVTAVEKALLLMRFQVPCGVLAYVFGREARSWYRLQQGLGRFSVVGTTVQVPAR